jgi:YesN/AraC family two-component response regulator
MPEMDGLTLCKLLKSNDKTSHIPIILLTAKTNVEQRIEGLEMGADSYIPKPFNLKHLETRIQKLVQLRETLKNKYSGNLEVQQEEIKVVSADEKLFQKFNNKLKEQISDPNLSVESISRDLGLSRVHLNRRLKAITKESPGNYIRNFRLKQAAWLLSNKKMTIAEVAYAVGFSSHAYFSNIFKEHFGMSPSEYMDVNNNKQNNIINENRR